ncbi:hypothetical protein LX36DRAFT_664468, partial [Colletotrichum falcatum]
MSPIANLSWNPSLHVLYLGSWLYWPQGEVVEKHHTVRVILPSGKTAASKAYRKRMCYVFPGASMIWSIQKCLGDQTRSTSSRGRS